MGSLAATRRLQVVLVDDHPVVRAGYRRLLELDGGVDVIGEHGDAESLLDALADPQARMPEVVVTDLSMPGRGGLELLRELKRLQPSLRVLVFSMHHSAAIVAEALRLGAAGFVTKISAPQELIAALHRIARRQEPALSSDIASRYGSGQPPAEALSLKEAELLRLLAEGHSLQAIADNLQLSAKTISNYQTALRQKLGVQTSIELVRYAREHGYSV